MGSPSFFEGLHLHPFKGDCKEKEGEMAQQDAHLSWALRGVVSGLLKSGPWHMGVGREEWEQMARRAHG